MTQATPLSEGAQRILRIAAPLFAVKGFSGVSINDIAEAVGGSKANIFHHFPNKQALYLAAIGSACEAFRSEYGKAEATGCARSPGGTSPACSRTPIPCG